MTKRDFFTNVANGTINNEISEYARLALEKMDESTAKRRAKVVEKTVAQNEPIKAAIVEFLTNQNEGCTATTIAEAVDISVQKAGSLLRQLLEAGNVKVDAALVKGKGARKMYTVVGV